MNLDDTGTLLAKIAAIDNRVVDEYTILGWQELLANISLPNALDALNEHRRNSPGVYLEPGHILAGARLARNRNLDRMKTPEPPETLEGIPAREIGWQQTYRRLIGDGMTEAEADAQACAEHGVTRPAIEATPRPVAALTGTHKPTCTCGCLTRPIRPEERRA